MYVQSNACSYLFESKKTMQIATWGNGVKTDRTK